MKLSKFLPNVIEKLLNELKEEATGFVRSCDAVAAIHAEYKAYMRYKGQGWEVPISLTGAQAQNPDATIFQNLFENEYAGLFGRTVDGMEIEITVWAVNAFTPTEQVDLVAELPKNTPAKTIGVRKFFDAGLSRSVDASVFHRNGLKAGQKVEGPAIITEDETTVIVPTSRIAVMYVDGTIELLRKV